MLWGKRKPEDWKEGLYKIGRDIALAPIKTLTFVGYLSYRAARKGIDIAAGKRTFYSEPDYDTLPITVVEIVYNSLGYFASAAGYMGSNERYKSGPNRGKLKATIELKRGIGELLRGLGLLLGAPVSIGERYQRERKAQTRSTSTRRQYQGRGRR